jgi:NitT/TauT family transport system permease protein
MMMSMSGGWFFVVASEAITVGDKSITLPGIGAYLAQTISERSLSAVGWVILAMTVVIVIYDQLMFRPLVAWADKFRVELTGGATAPQSWFLDLMRRTRLSQRLLLPVGYLSRRIVRLRLPLPTMAGAGDEQRQGSRKIVEIVWFVLVGIAAVYSAWWAWSFVTAELGFSDLLMVLKLGLYTLLRVSLLILLASIIWVPLGVMIGLRPTLAEKIQPLAQFLAAFPANLLFPIFVVGISRFHANPDIWLSPLIVLGTQWYILFNVVAGASAFPNDFREAAQNFRIRGWQWWRDVMLPGIFSYYVTGAITASGGAWNASIVAEAVSWGDTKLTAHGLGAYIAQTTADGDYPRIVLGIAVMSLYVILFNRLLWRPLYRYSEGRLRLD